MLAYYGEILAQFNFPPLWFNEFGCPRWTEFHPQHAGDVYATQCLLVEIQCQNCYAAFYVCMSVCDFEIHIHKRNLFDEIARKTLSYGDPPNIRCCPAGPTMNSETIRVVQAWSRMLGGQWVRQPNLEIDF